MLLTELIRADLVRIGLEATSKWEAIEELVDVLISAHELRLTDRNKVVKALFARERSSSTGMEHGLAVPHSVVTCVDDVIAALGTSKEGIPFESVDGRPAHLIVVLLMPKGAFQRHVSTLAGIAKLGSTPELREAIVLAGTSVKVMEILVHADSDACGVFPSNDPEEV